MLRPQGFRRQRGSKGKVGVGALTRGKDEGEARTTAHLWPWIQVCADATERIGSSVLH